MDVYIGAPLLIVTISVAAAHDQYGHEKLWAFYYYILVQLKLSIHWEPYLNTGGVVGFMLPTWYQ